MKNIAIFASGSGTNAQKIAEYFKGSDVAKVELILTNRKDAPVIDRAKNLNIPFCAFSKQELFETNLVIDHLKDHKIDFIVLAGFLLLFPKNIISLYRQRIVNIHPALLPRHGGKGMYGNNVHKAVIENKDTESGISIHYVNDEFDEGEVIFQEKYLLVKDETPESLAQKIHELEHAHFPRVIEDLIRKL